MLRTLSLSDHQQGGWKKKKISCFSGRTLWRDRVAGHCERIAWPDNARLPLLSSWQVRDPSGQVWPRGVLEARYGGWHDLQHCPISWPLEKIILTSLKLVIINVSSNYGWSLLHATFHCPVTLCSRLLEWTTRGSKNVNPLVLKILLRVRFPGAHRAWLEKESSFTSLEEELTWVKVNRVLNDIKCL